MGQLSEFGPFPALSRNMKGTIFLLIATTLISSSAGAEILRSQSASWKADGHRYRAEISTRADNGCKRITYRKDGLETAGHDCNCDLIVDGREYDHVPPPERVAQPLQALCLGPEADPASYVGDDMWIGSR
ncbi:MAG: hypothetical protein AAFZ91_09280 [Pseudomonadota bacterium]